MSDPQNNFLIFNEANSEFTTMSDADYASDLYRINGLIPMIADPIAHNKMFRQWSIMAKAIADMICDKGYDALDTSASDLKNNLKTAVKGLARDELSTEITTLGNIDTWKESITATPTEINTLDGITASTAELNTLDGITASTAELNTLDGVTVTSTEINYLDGASSNIQTQIDNLSISALIPFRQDSTPYAVGDVVKIAGLSPFQYLECIATGTSASSLPSFNRTTGHATQDGTAIWLVCDMRDGLQPGDFKLHISNTDLAGYIKDNQTILHFDKQTPIENATNWRLLRLFRLILNQALYTYSKSSLFGFTVTASTNTASTNPILLHGAGVVIMNEWCNFCPTTLTIIEDITLQDYIDISAYNTANSVSYTEAQYKQTAQTLLTDILAGSGAIDITVVSLDDRFIKMQDSEDYITYVEEESLPNITGSLGYIKSGPATSNMTKTGAIYWKNLNNQANYASFSAVGGAIKASSDITFNASDSNAIYGRSNHVRPYNVHLRPFIKY